MISIFILFFIKFISLASCKQVKATDLCIVPDMNCYLNCNAHEDKIYKCHGEFNHECSVKYCAKSNEVCERFQSSLVFLSVIKNSAQYGKKLERFQMLIKNMAVCSLSSYSWSANSTKISEYNCLLNVKDTIQSYLIWLNDCPCKRNSSSLCARDLCTIHKRECNRILWKELVSNGSNFVDLYSLVLIFCFIFLIVISLVFGENL